ncbi:hypothetical protein KPH14_013012 [Odynerus spinipes]|uniref:Uncharacterized protein n=1 Tax=Odynerus spinipes TaxID=1348599 RepID=A0AAD9R9C8_9HYME|nr:hypothetical protein KPH14_013012 [Odynerus spinipes]
MESERKVIRGRPSKQAVMNKIAEKDEKQPTITCKTKGINTSDKTVEIEQNADQNMTIALDKMMLSIKTMMEEIRNVREEIREIRKDHEEIIDVVKEITNMKKTIEEKDLKWSEEKRKLEDRITILERADEERKRKEKKCNIIIKGLNGKGTMEEIKQFMQIKLKIEPKIETTQVINTGNNNKMIRVKLADWENKQLVNSNKKLLKGEQIYIDNDLTKRQREIQSKINKYAKEQREKGRNTKIGYQRLQVDDELLVWKEGAGLVKSRLFRKQEN